MIVERDEDEDYQGFVLSTGRKIYNASVLGINPELQVLTNNEHRLRCAEHYGEDWTREELIEVADYAISLWTKFKEQQ